MVFGKCVIFGNSTDRISSSQARFPEPLPGAETHKHPFFTLQIPNLKAFCFKKKRVNSQLAVNWYFHKKTDQM